MTEIISFFTDRFGEKCQIDLLGRSEPFLPEASNRPEHTLKAQLLLTWFSTVRVVITAELTAANLLEVSSRRKEMILDVRQPVRKVFSLVVRKHKR